MRPLLLTGIVAVTAGGAPRPCCDVAFQPAASPPTAVGIELGAPRPPAGTVRVKLAVRGMTCGSCAVTVRLVLQRVDGIYRAEVSHDSATAVVWYDPVRTSPQQFIAKLREMTGYEARAVEEIVRKEKAAGTE